VKFPLPNPQDPFSLKPGSLPSHSSNSKASELGTSSSLSNAIAGARLAAAKFSKGTKDQSGTGEETEVPVSMRTRSKAKDKAQEVDHRLAGEGHANSDDNSRQQ